MIGILVAVFKAIVTKLLTTSALSFLHPHLLRLDKWCEDKLGIDIVKQDKKFHETYPLISERLEKLERDSHPKCGIESFDGIWSILFDTILKASAYKVISVSNTKTLWFFSTAKYSAAVKAMSGIKSLSTGGLSVVLMKQMILSKTPSSSNKFLKNKETTY